MLEFLADGVLGFVVEVVEFGSQGEEVLVVEGAVLLG